MQLWDEHLKQKFIWVMMPLLCRTHTIEISLLKRV